MGSVDIPWCYVSFEAKSLESLSKQKIEEVEWLICDLKKIKTIPYALVYFIELGSLEKHELGIVANIAKKYKTSHIYLFGSKALQTTSFYRFALLIKAKSIHTTPINSEAMLKLLNEIKVNIKNDIRQEELLNVLSLLENNLPFIYYREKKAKLISESAKKFFEGKNLKSLPPMSYFEKNPFVYPEGEEAEAWKSFSFICKNSKERTAICFFPFGKKGEQNSQTKLNHRFETIEWLKNQYETPDERHSFIFILFRLENCGIVQNQLDCLKYHDWEKKILNLLTAKMPDCLFLSKWNESHYLACYDIQAQAENIVDKVFQKLINFEDGSVPILETYIWQSKKASLVKTVDTLDLISYSQDCFKDLNNLNIIVMHSEDDSLTESEKIFRMLYACIAPKTTLKLQNIYKGLCINTNSRVLKEKDGMLYLECQPAQAYAIKESRNVTILSDMFIRDIHASVKLVDIEKKFIVIDEFFYLDTSANSRQYTRVQTRVRTPIALKQERLQFQGDIIDISLKSLAFATRLPISELSYHKGVTFNFHLPDETLEEGFCSIKGTGEIVYTGILNSRENKIVIMMNLKDPYDSYLLRYMYMRQKELIEELKNISKSIVS